MSKDSIRDFMDSPGDERDLKAFIDRLMEESKDKEPPQFPLWFVNEDGGQIELYLTDEPHYEKWIDSGVSLHVNMDDETPKIVGLTIPLTKEGMGRIEEALWLFP